jgi:hypothetical protein
MNMTRREFAGAVTGHDGPQLMRKSLDSGVCEASFGSLPA